MSEKGTTRQKTAVVIGAGVGGVSTAARLAKAGFAVTVIEKNDFTGGRCSLLRRDGHRFDQGPSLLLLPHLFHRTFADLDTTLEAEGVELRKCEPNYQIWFGDGHSFRLSSDLAVMKREVEKWEGKEGYTRYLDFLREAHAHYELSVTHVLLRNFTSLWSMFRPSFLRHLLQLHPFESIYTRASMYFWTERLRRVFTFGSMYMGMSPFDAPGTYSLLQYTELAEGIWYPVGGFHRVVEALVEVGKREGVRYRLGTAVEKIVVSADGKKVEGVRLEGGEVVRADVVVNNSDLVYAYNHLLEPSDYSRSLAERPTSCSSISFYWGLSQQVPQLEAHNIFLADEYKESFDSIFKRHLIPNEPSFYVNVPSRIDKSAAPKSKDSVVVLVPVGHLISPSSTTTSTDPSNAPITTQQDWPTMIAHARRTILNTIHARTGVDLAPLIATELTNDPVTWKQRFNLDRGAILGLSHSFFNVLCFRPTTRARRPTAWDHYLPSSRKGGDGGTMASAANTLLTTLLDAIVPGSPGTVEGLYFVGASSHPGTGVPICLAGAAIVAEQVLDDRGISVPWRRAQRLSDRSRPFAPSDKRAATKPSPTDSAKAPPGGAEEPAEHRLHSLDCVRRPWWRDSWDQWVSALLVLVFAGLIVSLWLLRRGGGDFGFVTTPGEL